MKKVVFVSIVVAILLAGCSTPTPLPEPTTKPTLTLPPTKEPTATLEQTAAPEPTEVPIPESLQQYVELGYDKLNDGTTLYVVVDETKVHYTDLTGIAFKGRLIRSWYEVDYIDENGVVQHGNVLSWVRSTTELSGRKFTRIIFTNQGTDSPNVPMEYLQMIEDKNRDRTPGNYPIYEAILGVEEGDYASEQIFDDFFPVVNGVPLPVTIPGIGEVLPITRIILVPEPTVDVNSPDYIVEQWLIEPKIVFNENVTDMASNEGGQFGGAAQKIADSTLFLFSNCSEGI